MLQPIFQEFWKKVEILKNSSIFYDAPWKFEGKIGIPFVYRGGCSFNY